MTPERLKFLKTYATSLEKELIVALEASQADSARLMAALKVVMDYYTPGMDFYEKYGLGESGNGEAFMLHEVLAALESEAGR